MNKSTQVLLLFISMLFAQCGTSDSQCEVTIRNPSSINLSEKSVTISRSMILNIPAGNLFPVITTEMGDAIPAQLDDINGDGIWDELFFVSDISAKEIKKYYINWVENEPYYPSRTSVRFGKRSSPNEPVVPAIEETLAANEIYTSLGYQRYQTDGPSWENDKVGFRHYLDGRNSKDLFGKISAAISPEDVGINEEGAVEDNYHEMSDWGRDVLSVGNSVGIGGFGLKVKDKLFRLGVTLNDSVNNVEETHFKIKTEGPVRSILSYHYRDWRPLDRIYSVTETTAIWPGTYGYKNTVKFSGLLGDEELVIGLVNINTDQPLTQIDLNDQFVILYTHDKQTYEKEWWLGLALIIPKDKYLGFFEAPKQGQLSNTFLARLEISNNEPIEYFAIGCWELSDEHFVDEDYFVNYLEKLTSELSVELVIEI